MIGLKLFLSTARWVSRNLIPESQRKHIHKFINQAQRSRALCNPYVRSFGMLRGLQVYYKLTHQKKRLIVVRIPQSRTPIVLRSNTSDIPTFQEIFLTGEYSMDVIVDPELVIDGGANIGLASVYFSNKYPRARIIAVEPESSNFALLEINTSRYPNVTRIQSAIWHERGWLRIADPEAPKWGFRVEQAPAGENSFPSITIEDLLTIANAEVVDILKLDIEGAEREVFSHNSTWLAKVRVLTVEVHDYINPGCVEALFSAVSRYDFSECRNVQKNDVIMFAVPACAKGPKWKQVLTVSNG